MAGLFASGTIVDLILAGVALEALALVLLRDRFGPGLRALLVNLGSGAALLLALRAALDGSGWPTIAAWLLAGLVAHLADLGLRLRRSAGGRLVATSTVRAPEL